MRVFAVLLVGWLGAAGFIWAQPLPPKLSTQVQAAILDLDGERLDALLASAKAAPGLAAYYRHHLLFAEALALGRADLLAGFELQSELFLTAMQQAPAPYNTAYVAQAYTERALVHLLAKDRLSALWDFSQAHGLTEELAQEAPGAYLHQRLEGLFLLAVSALPSTYQWMARQLGFEGDYARGLADLAVADRDPLLGGEAGLYRYVVQKHLEGNATAAYTELQALQRAYPGSPLVAYLFASHLLELRRGEEALGLLKATLAQRSTTALQMPFFYHQLGRCYLFRGNYAEAEESFRTFLRLQSGALLRRDAQFRRGICLAQQGHAAAAEVAFGKVWDEPISGFDDDRAASLQAYTLTRRSDWAIDLALYRARYASDGGYFQVATAVLDSLESAYRLSEDHLLETAYRRARIAHQQGQTEAARKHYVRAAIRQPTHGGWMLPYSHYYLGTLSEAAGKHAEALAYYEQALTFSGFAYEQGLEQKAKSGRSRMRRALRQRR